MDVPNDIEARARELARLYGTFENRAAAYAAALMAERDEAREKVAQFMLRNSLATGHGDTIDDLLGELEAQVTAIRRGTA